MPLENTFGRLLVHSALPDGVPKPDVELSKRNTAALYQAIADIAPDKYREVSKKLSDLGAEASTLTGGYSFGPEHLRPTQAVNEARARLAAEMRAVLADSSLTDKQRSDKLVHLGLAHTQPITDAVKGSTAGNPLALQASSGAKGNIGNVKSLMAGDTLYSDSDYNPVPYPITSSFYEGLRPHEYVAGTFGARLAITLTKLGTAAGGYASKRMRNMTHRLVVTSPDAEESNPNDPPTGLKVTLDDPDNEGAVLARDTAGFKRNTVITRGVMNDLKRQGHEHVFVRSPMIGGPPDGGVYGYDVGVRERGGIAPVGDQIGIAASDSISEPMTQSIIGSKHTGGIAGGTSAQQGFPVLDKLISIPTDYGGAVHAENDGVLSSVRDAPQGGKYVVVGGVEHYVPVDREITAKHGDKVEAGDPLTDGLENPAKYVEHKGIGEARRRFVDAFMKASQAAGFRPHRRNLEIVARGYLDHVQIHQETGEHVPGDVVSYTALAHDYEPREGHKVVAPKDALGHYLERPALHFSIGTRITPRVIGELQDGDVRSIPVHPSPPPFSPIAVRSHESINQDSDVLTRMLGTGLQKTLLTGVARGQTSDLKGTSFVGALAEGNSFGGADSKTRGWQSDGIIKPSS